MSTLSLTGQKYQKFSEILKGQKKNHLLFKCSSSFEGLFSFNKVHWTETFLPLSALGRFGAGDKTDIWAKIHIRSYKLYVLETWKKAVFKRKKINFAASVSFKDTTTEVWNLPADILPVPLYSPTGTWEKPLAEPSSDTEIWYGGLSLISVCISARFIFVDKERVLLYLCLVLWMKLSVQNLI